VRLLDPASLRAALAAVPEGSWSLPSTYRETKVHHGYRRVVLVSAGIVQPAALPFADALTEFAPVREAWLSSIEPGGFIVPHRDAGPWLERWQVPIQASGLFDDRRPEDGVCFQVEHWKRHSVWNDGDQPRIHIVIDRDMPLNLPAEPFELYPVPEKFAPMIEAAR
jgi:hypothetical protein